MAKLNSQESALLNCGNYFADCLKTSVESVTQIHAFHLYPEILKSIYRNELPQTIVEHGRKEYIKKVNPENALSKFIESLDFYFDNPILVTDELLELKIKS